MRYINTRLLLLLLLVSCHRLNRDIEDKSATSRDYLETIPRELVQPIRACPGLLIGVKSEGPKIESGVGSWRGAATPLPTS